MHDRDAPARGRRDGAMIGAVRGPSDNPRLLVAGRFFFFQAEDGIRDWSVTGVQTCALPIYRSSAVGWIVSLVDQKLDCGRIQVNLDILGAYPLDDFCHLEIHNLD